MKKKLIAIVCLICMLVSITPVWAASDPVLLSSGPITSGAVMKNYKWDTESGTTRMHVMELDLTNPYLKIDVMVGKGELAQKQNVSAMVQQNGAIGGINADFFNMSGEGAPIGATVKEGELISSPSYINGVYALGITKDNTAYIDAFSFSGKVTASNGSSFPLAGINKTPYWEENDKSHSHIHKLQLYTDAWGSVKRGNDQYVKLPTEVLVQNGIVTDMKVDGSLDYKVPDDSYILRGDGNSADYLKQNVKVGDSIDIQYQMSPDKDWKMVVGGHALLVENGQAIPYKKSQSSLDGLRARSAAGISKDGKKLYLVGVEGKTKNSKGLKLKDLAYFMQYVGCWKAVNLDGGGSTTMVSRPLGEFDSKRVFATEQGSERYVVDAIGIFSTAPKGALKGILPQGQENLLLGETATYNYKLYDEYYNPLKPEEYTVGWSDTASLGNWNGNVFTAKQVGTTEIVGESNGVKGTKTVKVLGKNDIANLSLSMDNTKLVDGSNAQLTAKVKLKDGTTKTVSPSVLVWKVEGFDGQVSSDGKLTVNHLGNSKQGKVTASYDGLTASITLNFRQSSTLHSLNTMDGVKFDSYPSTVTGSLVTVDNPTSLGNKVVQLSYNFGTEAKTVAAYAAFNDGLPVDKGTGNVYLDVYGRGNNEWLRIELRDANGELQRYDLGSGKVNWNGWKQVSLNLANKNLAEPVTIERIYVADVANSNRNQEQEQNILLKNLRMDSGVHLELTVGSKTIVTDGGNQQMDVAPAVINGRTLVPIRFISEALGAGVDWDQSSQTAVITYQNDTIKMTNGSAKMTVNGQMKALDVPPQVVSGRTMVPLRAIAEAFGLQVEYEQTTQKIVIQS